MHEVADAGEAAAEGSAGVQVSKVLGLEAGAAGELKGEGIAEGKHDGGGGCGGKIESTGFAIDGTIDRDGGGESEGGGAAPGEGEQRNAKAGEGGEEANELFGFAGIGEGEDGVRGGERAKVTVESLSGMEEYGG